MPLYKQYDDGKARPAKVITGYRWYHNDPVEFQKSIHMRFGSMSNDVRRQAHSHRDCGGPAAGLIHEWGVASRGGDAMMAGERGSPYVAERIAAGGPVPASRVRPN